MIRIQLRCSVRPEPLGMLSHAPLNRRDPDQGSRNRPLGNGRSHSQHWTNMKAFFAGAAAGPALPGFPRGCSLGPSMTLLCLFVLKDLMTKLLILKDPRLHDAARSKVWEAVLDPHAETCSSHHSDIFLGLSNSSKPP